MLRRKFNGLTASEIIATKVIPYEKKYTVQSGIPYLCLFDGKVALSLTEADELALAADKSEETKEIRNIKDFMESMRQSALAEIALEDEKFKTLLAAFTYYSLREEILGDRMTIEEREQSRLASDAYTDYTTTLGPKLAVKMQEKCRMMFLELDRGNK